MRTIGRLLTTTNIVPSAQNSFPEIVPMAQINLILAGLNAGVRSAAASLPATTVVMGGHGCGLFGF